MSRQLTPDEAERELQRHVRLSRWRLNKLRQHVRHSAGVAHDRNGRAQRVQARGGAPDLQAAASPARRGALGRALTRRRRARRAQVAVQEVRRLQRFGVTAGELDRYRLALLRDSEQAAEQADSVPSSDTLDFLMESLTLGHTVITQREVSRPAAAQLPTAYCTARFHAGVALGGVTGLRA